MATSHRCEGCRALAEERSDIPDSEKGVFVGLVPWIDPEIADAVTRLHPDHTDDE